MWELPLAWKEVEYGSKIAIQSPEGIKFKSHDHAERFFNLCEEETENFDEVEGWGLLKQGAGSEIEDYVYEMPSWDTRPSIEFLANLQKPQSDAFYPRKNSKIKNNYGRTSQKTSKRKSPIAKKKRKVKRKRIDCPASKGREVSSKQHKSKLPKGWKFHWRKNSGMGKKPMYESPKGLLVRSKSFMHELCDFIQETGSNEYDASNELVKRKSGRRGDYVYAQPVAKGTKPVTQRSIDILIANGFHLLPPQSRNPNVYSFESPDGDIVCSISEALSRLKAMKSSRTGTEVAVRKSNKRNGKNSRRNLDESRKLSLRQPKRQSKFKQALAKQNGRVSQTNRKMRLPQRYIMAQGFQMSETSSGRCVYISPKGNKFKSALAAREFWDIVIKKGRDELKALETLKSMYDIKAFSNRVYHIDYTNKAIERMDMGERTKRSHESARDAVKPKGRNKKLSKTLKSHAPSSTFASSKEQLGYLLSQGFEKHHKSGRVLLLTPGGDIGLRSAPRAIAFWELVQENGNDEKKAQKILRNTLTSIDYHNAFYAYASVAQVVCNARKKQSSPSRKYSTRKTGAKKLLKSAPSTKFFSKKTKKTTIPSKSSYDSRKESLLSKGFKYYPYGPKFQMYISPGGNGFKTTTVAVEFWEVVEEIGGDEQKAMKKIRERYETSFSGFVYSRKAVASFLKKLKNSSTKHSSDKDRGPRYQTRHKMKAVQEQDEEDAEESIGEESTLEKDDGKVSSLQDSEMTSSSESYFDSSDEEVVLITRRSSNVCVRPKLPRKSDMQRLVDNEVSKKDKATTSIMLQQEAGRNPHETTLIFLRAKGYKEVTLKSAGKKDSTCIRSPSGIHFRRVQGAIDFFRIVEASKGDEKVAFEKYKRLKRRKLASHIFFGAEAQIQAQNDWKMLQLEGFEKIPIKFKYMYLSPQGYAFRTAVWSMKFWKFVQQTNGDEHQAMIDFRRHYDAKTVSKIMVSEATTKAVLDKRVKTLSNQEEPQKEVVRRNPIRTSRTIKEEEDDDEEIEMQDDDVSMCSEDSEDSNDDRSASSDASKVVLKSEELKICRTNTMNIGSKVLECDVADPFWISPIDDSSILPESSTRTESDSDVDVLMGNEEEGEDDESKNSMSITRISEDSETESEFFSFERTKVSVTNMTKTIEVENIKKRKKNRDEHPLISNKEEMTVSADDSSTDDSEKASTKDKIVVKPSSFLRRKVEDKAEGTLCEMIDQLKMVDTTGIIKNEFIQRPASM